MKKLYTILFFFFVINSLNAQGPEVTSWIINLTGATGYNNIPSNVQQVQYGASNVYVSVTCIPSYTIGPWPGNPNTPVNQNFVFQITRSPQQNTGTPTVAGLGHIGVWSNGVTIFNPRDAMSYNNQNVWHQNAEYWEGSGFDNCLGHPSPGGEYHHHVNPTCLYNDADSLGHSPIIGYAFDGFPIYGAYGYANPSSPGTIKRMLTSYQERNITTRTTLPDGTTASSAGPPVNAQYPIGAYVEDFEYIAVTGDLDEHNGRFCITPEYPSGIYAYFVTIDENLDPVYPYVLGPSYYGTVQPGNTGPNSGHVIPTETVVIYNPGSVINEVPSVNFSLFPNPFEDELILFIDPVNLNDFEAQITDATGRVIRSFESLQTAITYRFDVSELSSGIYFLRLNYGNVFASSKLIIKSR
jgi:hypothetical protein